MRLGIAVDRVKQVPLPDCDRWELRVGSGEHHGREEQPDPGRGRRGRSHSFADGYTLELQPLRPLWPHQAAQQHAVFDRTMSFSDSNEIGAEAYGQRRRAIPTTSRVALGSGRSRHRSFADEVALEELHQRPPPRPAAYRRSMSLDDRHHFGEKGFDEHKFVATTHVDSRRTARAGLGSEVLYRQRPPRPASLSRSRSFGDSLNFEEETFDEHVFVPTSHEEFGRGGSGGYGPERIRSQRPSRRAALSRSRSFGDRHPFAEATFDEHGFVPIARMGFGREASGSSSSQRYSRERPSRPTTFTRSKSLGDRHDLGERVFRERDFTPAAHRNLDFEAEVPLRFVSDQHRIPRSYGGQTPTGERPFELGVPKDFDHGRSSFGTRAVYEDPEPFDDFAPSLSPDYETPESPFDLFSGDQDDFGFTPDVFNRPFGDDRRDFHASVNPIRASALGRHAERRSTSNRGSWGRRQPRHRTWKKRKITPVVSEEPSGIEPDAGELSVPTEDDIPKCTFEGLEGLVMLDGLDVQEDVKPLESFAQKFTGMFYEASGRYKISNQKGAMVFHAVENTGLCWRCWAAKKLRPTRMEIYGQTDAQVMAFQRRFRLFPCTWFEPCRENVMVYHSDKNGTMRGIGRVTQLCCSGYVVLNKRGDRELLVKRRCSMLGNWWWRRWEIRTEEEATCVGEVRNLAPRTLLLGLDDEIESGDKINASFPKDLKVETKATLLALLVMLL